MKNLMVVYGLALLSLIFSLTGCGKDIQQQGMTASQAASVSCLSTAVTYIDDTFFPINDAGVFVPDGWISSVKPDACNQVQNAILSTSTYDVVVSNGQIQVAP